MIHGIETLKVGSLGTFHALDVARKYGAKYLVSSTSECYGDPLEHPQKETYWGNVNSIGPRSVYDEAKRFTEAVTMAYHRYHKVDTRIVRIFNTYGPRMQLNDGRVVSQLHEAGSARRTSHRLRQRQPDPQLLLRQRRNRRLPSFGEVLEHLPVNIGNPNEFTILECAQHVMKGDRIEKQNRLRTTARRTIPNSAARHHQSPHPAGLGTEDSAGSRPENVAGLF
jgi:dTDP-glucose 4,6-dehydratase